MELFFVTSNKWKFAEVKNLIESLTKGKIVLKQADLDIPELDSADLTAISQDKAIKAFKQLQKPLIVDDSGIYFDEYNSFPWSLAKRVFKWLGFKGLHRLLKDAKNKKWKFITVVSYLAPGMETPISFQWVLTGEHDFSWIEPYLNKWFDKLPLEERQKVQSLPYKYIFKPDGFDKFYFQLNLEESQKVSQRAQAVKKLVEYLKANNA